MDLSHLDDATPPRPDASMRSGVVAAARRRRRVRVTFEAAAAVVVIVAVVTTVAATRTNNDHVRVATKPPTTTVPNESIAEGHVGVTVELDTTTVAAGDDLTGTLVFVNPSSDVVQVNDGHSCVSKFAMVVDTSTPKDMAWTDECAISPGPLGAGQSGVTGSQYLVIPPGTTRVPFRSPTRRLLCITSEGSQAEGSHLPDCDANGGPPKLPAGPAFVYFLSDTRGTSTPVVDIPAPAPITITG